MHVRGFSFLLFDGTVDNAIGSAVVGVNRCGWLWMAEFNEGEAKKDGESCIEKEGGNSSLETEAITFLMILVMTAMEPLTSKPLELPRKMKPSARL